MNQSNPDDLIVLSKLHLSELLFDNPALDDIPFQSTIPFRNYSQPYPLKARWEVGYIIRNADPEETIFKIFLYPELLRPGDKPSHAEIWEKRAWELSDAMKFHNGLKLEQSVKKIDKKLDKVYRLCQKIFAMLGDRKAAEDVARKIVDGEYKPDSQFMNLLGIEPEDLKDDTDNQTNN